MEIRVLDGATINKIAAGEVIERPLSIVKELVENSIDAGADAITVEIKGGGIDFIRVTDNGSGIDAGQVRTAFLPHATSKIRSAEDLFDIRSLGFRGEALSTVAAVSRVEMITKVHSHLTGVRYVIDCGREVSLEEIGCGDGTTMIARDLFLNVPARRKFLKSAATEAGYITEFIQRIAIERSDISFKYVVNNDNKLVTTGNGSVKDNIYRVYGREISDALLTVTASDNGMSLTGYVARPYVARNNRNCEIFFVNGHGVNDRILEKAVETAYKPFLMQHRFPFVFLLLALDPGMVDLNVHPRKTEVKFSMGTTVYDFVESAVERRLRDTEHLNVVELAPEKKPEYKPEKEAPEPFETVRSAAVFSPELIKTGTIPQSREISQSLEIPQNRKTPDIPVVRETPDAEVPGESISEARQLDLFEEKLIEPSKRPQFRIVGCVFDTYWIIEYNDRMLMIDQHAAHEKVMYEDFVKSYKEKKVVSQYIDPPVMITLDARQEMVIERHIGAFESLGFEIEKFEKNDYVLRAIPSGFMKLEERDIFTGLLDEMSDTVSDTDEISVIHDRLAQMSCKAAVKGGDRLSLMEAEELLTRLLSLDNPYNCPHGRPTMVEFTEKDLEKFFKRIV